ncbi:MAG: hydrogenase 4 subunit B [Candidatus Odinarchaeota archaeon]|nr:hydrogenase 4 subunit B [Candidatus Odinarchaeota archaeon]
MPDAISTLISFSFHPYLYISIYLFSALISLLLFSKPKLNIKISYSLCALASLVALFFSSYALITNNYPIVISGIKIPGFEKYFGDAGFFSFYLDALSLFLVIVISLVAFYTSVFSMGYTEMYIGEHSISYLNFFYVTFILSMILVVLTNDALSFYICWELMTITSYMLVGYEHLNKENRDAAKIYFIIAHMGGACILLTYAILVLFTGSFSFVAFRAYSLKLSMDIASIIFVLALVGFGSKAGIVPFHAWLPLAHPAAPSNASALLSGVMIKVAIYGLIRVIFDFLEPAGFLGEVWGCTVLLVGALSTIIGVLFAVVQNDVKRLLAYSSIENIGIILLGVGTGILLYAMGSPGYACLALTAGLYHLLNHAVFKSLLFLGSGSIVKSCKTRNYELLGGLSKYLPYTSIMFLIAAISISAIPPFNGFASEWLTYQSLLISALLALEAAPWISCVAIFSVLILGLAGALAIMCFTQVYGVTFLGLPRHVKPKRNETHSMKIGVIVPAIACILLGLLMPFVVTFIGSVVSHIVGASIPTGANIFTIHLISTTIQAQLSLPGMALVVGLISLLIGLIIYSKKVKVEKTDPWVCGAKYAPEVMEATATAYTSSIRYLFGNLYGLELKEQKEYSVTPIYYSKVSYEVKFNPKIEAYTRIAVSGPPYTTTGRLPKLAITIERLFYKPFIRPIIGILRIKPEYEERITFSPIAKIFTKLGEYAKKIQIGVLYFYMLYILIAVIFLLILAVMLP